MERLDKDPARLEALRARVLEWYARNRRDLPWRKKSDPYGIWISEIMLQQTRVAVVTKRYRTFLTRFPTLISLALAHEEEVLALWSGLGYYNRARTLLKTAKFVAENLGGNLPARAEQLRDLPGIGEYTAAAIASIAHGEPVAVVDGNVERVICRLAGWNAGSRKGGGAALRHKIAGLAGRLLDAAHPGDFNQAMMELGATVCAPSNPRCLLCPLHVECKTHGEHRTPRREPLISREAAHALSVRINHSPGKHRGLGAREVLLQQRPAHLTVMPGLWELPPLRETSFPEQNLRMTVRHAIMRVNYYVRIRTVFEDDVEEMTLAEGTRRWVPLGEAAGMALTGLTRKVLLRARLMPAMPVDAMALSMDETVS